MPTTCATSSTATPTPTLTPTWTSYPTMPSTCATVTTGTLFAARVVAAKTAIKVTALNTLVHPDAATAIRVRSQPTPFPDG